MNDRKIGILISYINILLQIFIGFIYVPMLLYYIGENEYGLYQLVGSMIAYLGIMDFGLTTAVIRFYTKYKSTNDRVGMENILAISLRLYAFIIVILLGLGIYIYYNIQIIFYGSLSIEEIIVAKQLFVFLLFNIILTISTMIFRAVIHSHEKFLVLKGIESIQLILQPIIVLFFLKKYPCALSVVLVHTVLNVIANILRIYYCFFKLKIRIKFYYWNKEILYDFRKLALSVFVVSLMDQIFFKTNQVILGIVSGTRAVAIYSIATLIYVAYMCLSTSISGVYLPYITDIVTKNEPVKKLSEIFIQIGRWQFYLLALVASGFIIFGKQFINIWAGNGFEEAYFITLLIIIPFTIDLIQNIGLSILQAKNKYNFRAKVYFGMGVFNILLAVPLAYQYGGVGCAFATGMAMFIGNGIIMNLYYAKVINLDIKSFWKQIGYISFGVFGVMVIGYFINNYYYSDSIVFYCFKILIYTFIYVIVIFKWFMNENEKNKIYQICRRLLLKK